MGLYSAVAVRLRVAKYFFRDDSVGVGVTARAAQPGRRRAGWRGPCARSRATSWLRTEVYMPITCIRAAILTALITSACTGDEDFEPEAMTCLNPIGPSLASDPCLFPLEEWGEHYDDNCCDNIEDYRSVHGGREVACVVGSTTLTVLYQRWGYGYWEAHFDATGTLIGHEHGVDDGFECCGRQSSTIVFGVVDPACKEFLWDTAVEPGDSLDTELHTDAEGERAAPSSPATDTWVQEVLRRVLAWLG
jgi:hypothetical protein